MRIPCALVCLVLAAAPDAPYDSYLTGNEADAHTKTSPGLLLSGGGGDVDEAFRWLIAKAGGGDVVVLRASGSDGYNRYIPTLGAVNSVRSFVIRSPEAARDRELIQQIGQAEAVFLAGGDQWNYVRMWKGNAIGEAVNRAWVRGVPVGGSSAGLAVLGEYAFSAQNDTVTSAQALVDPFDKRVTIETEFLRFPPLRGVITDSHFSRRDRMGRLLVFLARLQTEKKADPRGIGIDEATAVLVETDGTARVAGKGSAFFVRLAEKVRECRPGARLDGARYEVVRVAAGEGVFDLKKWHGAGGTAYTLAVEQGVVRSSLTGNSVY